MKTMQKLAEEAEKLGIHLFKEQLEQFENYYEYLIETNKVMNLTAITQKEEVIEKHFLDSLSIVKIMDMKPVSKLLDMGTGAGFPGIPLKIAFPHLRVTLMDSLNKRVGFLTKVIENLQLEQIQAVHARAEDLGKNPKYRESFDVCVSRAVANLSSLSEYCIPFVKQEGYFISYKAGNVLEEISKANSAIQILSAEVEKVEEFLLPSGAERTLVKIKKIGETPKKFPRKAGLPTKKPIQ